ncbi:MAG: hotdog fold thioesterase [Cryomorphaceae bacterium]|nr:MAG: hotdog fold thioesterase [Cryomorphaceae bacterium]
MDLLEKANQFNKNTLMETLGIEYTAIGDDFIRAKMPVDHRTHQPMGLLHGGATAALAESMGSLGSYLMIDQDNQAVVGIEINANHLRSARKGYVFAEGKLIHKGKTLHVWDIKVWDEREKQIAICRLTNMIIPRP